MSQVILNLSSNIADKLNSYIRVFGDKELLFEKFIEFHKNRLKREIARMQIDLEVYEQKHKMTSEDFFNKFEKGELGDNQDFIIWSGIYEMQKDSKRKLTQLL